MGKIERIRDELSEPPGPDYWHDKLGAGFRLVAVEWAREVEGEAEPGAEEIPYGVKVAADCAGLEEDPEEMRALTHMLELIAEDTPLSHAAAELNRRGFRTRSGAAWTQMSVFYMLPRLIEAAPRIRSRREWAERRAG